MLIVAALCRDDDCIQDSLVVGYGLRLNALRSAFSLQSREFDVSLARYISPKCAHEFSHRLRSSLVNLLLRGALFQQE